MTNIERALGLTESDAIERVLVRARRYVEFETPSFDAAAITRLAEAVATDLEALGAAVERIPVGGRGTNLYARVSGAEAGLEPLLILAHMDTVHPVGTLAQRAFRVEDGRAYGPGVYDMKSGLAVAIEALAVLDERGSAPRRPVELLITCDEEVGSHSARDDIALHAKRVRAVLVPEPSLPDGGVKTFRKGVATYRVEAVGIAAHAGIDGGSAVSAITELVVALNSALTLADHTRGTTLNIGEISGGSASNVVAAHATAVIDVRIAEPDEGERIHAALTSLAARNPKAKLTFERFENRPPLVRTDNVVELYEHARQICERELGVSLAEGGTGGGSDGSLAHAAGAAVLDGLGPRGAGAHAVDEHIVLADLPFRLALMTRLLETL